MLKTLFIQSFRLASAIAFGVVLAGVTAAVQAQEPHVESIRLESGPLSTTLRTLAQTYGVNVLFSDEVVEGLEAPPVRGDLDFENAMAHALQGSGLAAMRAPSGAVIIEEAQPAATTSTPAPETPIEEVLVREEIIVYGELVDRSLQDVQTSVSVITGRELDRSVDKDLFDVIDRIPGVNAEGGGFGFVIRGVAPGGVGGGSAPTVNVQIDGANVPNGQALRTAALSTWDLQQVEVLRGPQSTQQGRSSLAGAIIMRSKDPTFDQEFKLRADYGSFNESRLAAAANLPLGESWAARIVVEDYQSDGDIENVFTGEDNAAEALTTVRGKLRFKPSDDFDAVLSYTYSDNEFGNQQVDDTRFPNERVSLQFSNTAGQTGTAALLLDYRVNDRWKAISETTYLDSDYELAIGIEPLNPRNTPGGREVDDTSFTQEFKFLYESERLTGVFGAYYQKLEKEVFFRAEIPDASLFLPLPPGTAAVFGNTFDDEIENAAIFGEATYKLSEQWSVIAGLRADTQEQSSTTVQFSEFIPDLFGLSATGEPVDLDSDYSAVLPKLSVIYSFSEDVSLSLTAQQAYRAGGAATDFIGNPYEFDPEYSNNYELALRSVLLDGRLMLNANLYLTDYTDMQVSVPGPSGTFLDSRIENAGEATMWGFELLTNYQVTRDIEIYANVGYAGTEFDDYVGADATGAPADLSGNQFPQAPEWTGSVGGNFSLGNGFDADFSINYTDESYYTPRNLPDELNEPFTLVNARLGYQSDSFWSAHLYARNLFDEQYLSRKRNDGSSTAGDSRVIGISVYAQF
ncbi:MAG: TonB-dependent receptor [Pseudomonadota bacterium]